MNSEVKREGGQSTPRMGDPLESSLVSSQKQNREGMVSPKRTISCYGGGTGMGYGGPEAGCDKWYQSQSLARSMPTRTSSP
ncbi:hypothetical protein ACFX2I_023911 [Malus domestica]